MRRRLATTATFSFLLGLPLSPAPRAVTHADLTFQTYAAGLNVLTVETRLALGPWNYQAQIRLHTVGLAGFLHPGSQVTSTRGDWSGSVAVPHVFQSDGRWAGKDRRTVIDYMAGRPVIRELLPPNRPGRLPVPPDLETGSTNTLSALATLIRQVELTGRCDLRTHVFEGRALTELAARTAGETDLRRSEHSDYAGRALRCDFAAYPIAGLRPDVGTEGREPAFSGSLWLGRPLAGAPMLPVRIEFATRWFGSATAYLTEARIEPTDDQQASRPRS